jgi:hypothetical protein
MNIERKQLSLTILIVLTQLSVNRRRNCLN